MVGPDDNRNATDIAFAKADLAKQGTLSANPPLHGLSMTACVAEASGKVAWMICMAAFHNVIVKSARCRAGFIVRHRLSGRCLQNFQLPSNTFASCCV